MGKKRLLINLVSNLISFILQLGISFILTPIIVEKVGDAAYGFIGLSNNFVSYANIFTIIINSMASRFITLELAKDKLEEANKYYSSVLFVNVIMSFFIAIGTLVLVGNLSVLNVPIELEKDVAITFILAFANLIISLIGTVYSIAMYAKNRLDYLALKTIIGNIIKIILLVVLFSFLPAKIYYITFATMVVSVYTIIANKRITKKIAPELKADIHHYDSQAIKTLSKSGIWNSINTLSKTLLTGLDLLIANIFIGPETMGVLSIAKTIPNSFEGLLGTIATIFSPQFVILYSKKKIHELVELVNFSLRLFGVLMIVPIAGFIVYGSEFFALWLPTKTSTEIVQLQILSVLSLLPYVISLNNFSLFLLDTVTNKLKRPVLVTMGMSIISTVTTILLLKTTHLGVYAVAGVSSVYWCVKVFFFNTINAAVNLRIKWHTFFLQFLKNLGCFCGVFILFLLLKPYLVLDTWLHFAVSVIIVGMIGYVCMFFTIFSSNDRKRCFDLLKEKLNAKNKMNV